MKLSRAYLAFCIFVFSGLGLIFILSLVCCLPKRLSRQMCSAILKHWSKFILNVYRIRISTSPDWIQSQQARVIIANHVSYLDIPILLSMGPCTFLAKKEVGDWPLIGFIARRLGVVFVQREHLWSRAQSILHIQNRLRQGQSMVIFPEGTTSEDGPRRGWVPYFAGAFRAARSESVPLESIYIDYSPVHVAAWTGNKALVPHLIELHQHGCVRVHLRQHLFEGIHTRNEQQQAHHLSRRWMLESGKAMWGSLPSRVAPF